jgi:hypothetical protein
VVDTPARLNIMNWPPEIADELPAPRDDEPSSLRQDIADELADHLQSSFARELHFTPEESSAKQNVLDRFGDPRRVARALWFDAMKEKLMSQRVNLVFSSLMTVACLGALGLMTLMLRDSREVNAAILEKLAALTAPHPAPQPAQSVEATPQSMDWVRSKFKLVLGEKGGPAAAGFKVQLQGVMGASVYGDSEKNGQTILGVVEEITGADGVVDLGLFRFGTYQLTVTSPWGENTSRQIGLRPGQDPVREIVCPAAAPEDVDVAFSVNWPEDLKEKELWLLCNFFVATRRVGSDTWFLNSRTPFNAAAGMGMGGMGMGGMGGTIVPGRIGEMLLVNADGGLAARGTTTFRTELATPGPPTSIEFTAPSQFEATYRFPALAYRITTSLIVDPNRRDGDRYVILARGPSASMGGQGGGFFNIDDRQKGESIHEGEGLWFELKPGLVNRWKIKLPDETFDQVRAALKQPFVPAEIDKPDETE